MRRHHHYFAWVYLAVTTAIGFFILSHTACTVLAQCEIGDEDRYCLRANFTVVAPAPFNYTALPVPFTSCKQFYICRDDKVANRLECGEGRLFNVLIGECDHEYNVICEDATCFPTFQPSKSPTITPTENPTKNPSGSPTLKPSMSPTDNPTIMHSVISEVLNKKNLIEEFVLKSYTADRMAYPSIRYTFASFYKSLQVMGVDTILVDDDGSDFQFLIWEGSSDKNDWILGLINLSAFLANVMVESIYDDTCDELNWQEVAGRYAISNACGQEGRSYQDETCGIYSCIVDPSMEVEAIHSANKDRAPPPMECGPGSGPGSYSGFWDTNTGTEQKETPYANKGGRTDIEGCCYWGRGALHTRGSCNIGKLNYFLGARAAKEGRGSLYPDIDFCLNPEATCASAVTEELKWSTAFFEWSERVQRYNDTGWDYTDRLFDFFDDGMVDDTFIDEVGRILVRGCIPDECSDLEVRFVDERKSNFYTIINDIFEIGAISRQTRKPTFEPTLFVSSSPEAPTVSPSKSPIADKTKPPNTEPPTPIPESQCVGQSARYVPINGCKDYLECMDGTLINQFTCPDNQIFDNELGKCNWEKAVIRCPDSAMSITKYPAPSSSGQSPIATPSGQSLTSLQTSNTESPVSNYTSTTVEAPRNICEDLPTGFSPIDECKEFVRCNSGTLIERSFCPQGLLFDISVGVCNFASSVICLAPALTDEPTNSPSFRPSVLPTIDLSTSPSLSQRPVSVTPVPSVFPSLTEISTPVDEEFPVDEDFQLPGTLVILEGNAAKMSWPSLTCAVGCTVFNLMLYSLWQ